MTQEPRGPDKSNSSPLGLPLGGFRLYPVLKFGASFDDNILYRDDDRQSDVIATLSPSASIQSQWSSHMLKVEAASTHRRYAEHSEQNTDEYGGKAEWRLDVTRTFPVSGSLEVGHRAEPRGTPGSDLLTSRYVMYDVAAATLGASKQFNRIILSYSGNAAAYRYDDLRSDDILQDQSYRDRNVAGVSGRVDYLYSSVTSLFVTGSFNRVRYQHIGERADRGSNGYALLGGVKFELSHLLHGEVSAGLIDYRFRDPLYPDFSGFNFKADIDYAPTALTSLSFTADRSLVDSALIGVPGVLVSRFRLGIDHELLRTLILSASISHNREKYQGIDRRQRRWSFGFSARKQVNDYVAVALSLDRQQQSAAGTAPGLRYHGNKISLNIIATR